ncbi:MAG: hypothetical protein L3J83_08580 [Proteobacteria bacterium]|nr:hypothetical protein [Pseudomonadota bacterium]
MKEDSIVSEIRKHRANHAAKYDNDLGKICEALRKKQNNSERKVVTGRPKILLNKTGS